MIVCSCNVLNEDELSQLTLEQYNKIVQCGKCRETWEDLQDELERIRKEGVGQVLEESKV